MSEEQNTQEQPSEQYAVVELFGHRCLAGRVVEVEKFGTKLLRIDIPDKGKFDNGYKTQFYGGASIFSLTPCDLATVERMNKPYERAGMLTYSEPEEDDDEPDVF